MQTISGLTEHTNNNTVRLLRGQKQDIRKIVMGSIIGSSSQHLSRNKNKIEITNDMESTEYNATHLREQSVPLDVHLNDSDKPVAKNVLDSL